jgi:hypothetical protein
MHRMTRDDVGAQVRAPFDGKRWSFKRDAAILEVRDGRRLMTIEEEGQPRRTYYVTRIIGGRTREDFVGVDAAAGAEEVILPVSFVYATGSLRTKGYSVMVHERPGLSAGPVWSRACIFCHNTVPELDRLLGELSGPRAHAYQGELVDRWLAPERRTRLGVTDAGAFAEVADAEVKRLGRPRLGFGDRPQAVARATLDVVRDAFRGNSLLEVGIGCEACHGGAKAHVLDPRVRPSLVPQAPWLDVSPHGAGAALAINRVCARCHQVLFSRYPFTWEGGRRDRDAGGSHINSGEARDFLLGACSSALACTDCHDPHGGGSAPGASSSDGGVSSGSASRSSASAIDGVCTRCHRELADPERLRAHAHHDPAREGGSCVACHMPRKNMGLGGVLTRYHRIGSPTDPARVLGDRPLECALCHLDKSVGSLVDTMEAWWPVRYPRQRLVELYGSLDAGALKATLERGKPHEKVVAMASLGEARDQSAAPLISKELLNDFPLVREWAKIALVSILGRCDVDLASDDAAIARQALSCGGGAMAIPATPSTGEEPED